MLILYVAALSLVLARMLPRVVAYLDANVRRI